MSQIQKRFPTGTFKAVTDLAQFDDAEIDDLLMQATTETPARKRLKTSEVQVVPRAATPPTPPALRPITEMVHGYGEQLSEHQRAVYAAMNLLAHRLHETEQRINDKIAEALEGSKQTNMLLEHNNNLQAHVYQQSQGAAQSFDELTQYWRENSKLNRRVLNSKITRTMKRVYRDPSQTGIGAIAGVLLTVACFALYQLIAH